MERIRAPIRGLHEAAYVLALLTLASQALALLRDRTFADLFGAGQTLDLYFAAFRIPDLVFALVASLVGAYVLIPRISGADPASVRSVLSQSVSFLLIIGGAIGLVLSVFMAPLLAFLYPDLAASPDASAFIALARLLLLQPILLGLSGIVTSVTQVNRRFTLFALSPVLYNLGIIVGAVLLYPLWGLVGIGAGVIFGAALHLAIHIPLLIEGGVMPRLTRPRLAELLPLIAHSVPRSFALLMGSITALILTMIAATIANGSVSVFTLAGNLEAVPLALIGVSYAVAAFPALSEASVAEKREEFTRILVASAKHLILWSLIALGLIVVLRAHLVRTILGSGAFDWDATRLTAAMLAILALGLVAQGLVLLFSRALYAIRESWRPFLYNVGGGCLTIALALFFLSLPYDGFPQQLAELFRVGDVPHASVLLLALASTLGQIAVALFATTRLARLLPGFLRSLVRPTVHGIAASLFGAVATYAVLALLGDIAPLTTLAAVFTEGLIAGMVGLIVSALTLRALRNEEFDDALRSIKRLPGIRSFLPPSAEEPVQP